MATLTRATVEEFLAGPIRPDVELVDGEEVVNDPQFSHQRIVRRLLVALANFVEARPGAGEAGFGGNWVLDAGSVLKPDVWWVSEAKRLLVTGTRTSVAPDLAVEVRSPGTVAFDLGRKKQIYEQSGVQEYWFVDTPAEVVIVFRRAATDGAVFDDGVEIDVDSPLTSPLFDGLSLALSELFAP